MNIPKVTLRTDRLRGVDAPWPEEFEKMQAGENLLELGLVYRDPRLDPFISLFCAELTVPAKG